MAQTKKSPKAAASKKPAADGGNKVFNDLRTKTDDQLNDQLVELKREQFNLRFQRATGQLANTARVKQVRRDIARLSTIASQKRAPSKT